MIDRDDYWQCAFVIPKGRIDDIHARGLPASVRRYISTAEGLICICEVYGAPRYVAAARRGDQDPARDLRERSGRCASSAKRNCWTPEHRGSLRRRAAWRRERDRDGTSRRRDARRRDRARGAPVVHEALPRARQITRALEAAHERSVIRRSTSASRFTPVHQTITGDDDRTLASGGARRGQNR